MDALVRSAVSPAAVAKKRKTIAFAIAAIADVVQLAFLPLFSEGAASPVNDVLDAVTALALLVVLGFRWRLAFALAMELVPGVDLLPTWTAVVLSLPTLPAQALPAETLPAER